jgi:hypothetical protein
MFTQIVSATICFSSLSRVLQMKIPLKLASILLMSVSCTAAYSQAVEIVPKAYQEGPSQRGPVIPIAPLAGVLSKGMATTLHWDVTMTDGTIRKVLEKWALSAGWTFGPEYWNAERDLPVMAKISFTGDFRLAVRNLLNTTAMTDVPVQPCFYNNDVLRVVPSAEICDRMVAQSR